MKAVLYPSKAVWYPWKFYISNLFCHYVLMLKKQHNKYSSMMT